MNRGGSGDDDILHVHGDRRGGDRVDGSDSAIEGAVLRNDSDSMVPIMAGRGGPELVVIGRRDIRIVAAQDVRRTLKTWGRVGDDIIRGVPGDLMHSNLPDTRRLVHVRDRRKVNVNGRIAADFAGIGALFEGRRDRIVLGPMNLGRQTLREGMRVEKRKKEESDRRGPGEGRVAMTKQIPHGILRAGSTELDRYLH